MEDLGTNVERSYFSDYREDLEKLFSKEILLSRAQALGSCLGACLVWMASQFTVAFFHQYEEWN